MYEEQIRHLRTVASLIYSFDWQNLRSQAITDGLCEAINILKELDDAHVSVLPDQDQQLKAQRDREYRDKRLMASIAIMGATQYNDFSWALKSADELIRANEEMAVPE